MYFCSLLESVFFYFFTETPTMWRRNRHFSFRQNQQPCDDQLMMTFWLLFGRLWRIDTYCTTPSPHYISQYMFMIVYGDIPLALRPQKYGTSNSARAIDIPRKRSPYHALQLSGSQNGFLKEEGHVAWMAVLVFLGVLSQIRINLYTWVCVRWIVYFFLCETDQFKI